MWTIAGGIILAVVIMWTVPLALCGIICGVGNAWVYLADWRAESRENRRLDAAFRRQYDERHPAPRH